MKRALDSAALSAGVKRRLRPRVLLGGLCFGEGPRWCDSDQRLYFSDMHARQVIAVDMRGNRETLATLPEKVSGFPNAGPSGLGFGPDGNLLAVSMADRRVVNIGKVGPPVEVADLSKIATFHCNDMVVDSVGRAYVGNFGWNIYEAKCAQKSANLALITPSKTGSYGKPRVVAKDLAFPNGMAISADGKSLVVAETWAARLSAYDIAPDGGLSGRRVWADLSATGVPDGICRFDAEGCIWVAVPLGPNFAGPGCCARVAPGGEIVEKIETAPFGAYACALGGARGRTLFILEAMSHMPGQTGPGNARIRTVEVGVPRAEGQARP